MHLSTAAVALATLLPSTLADTFQRRSDKRGLVFVPDNDFPYDSQIWVDNDSDLTWYYNYDVTPASQYNNRTQDEFEYVPQLWGAPSYTSDTTFSDGVKELISNGRNITNILTFNEPDGTSSTGGSQVDPAYAATVWINEIVPLQKLGIKAGAPAVTGSPMGFTWLESFFGNCTSQGTNCTVDFIPVHWYGNFDGLASHVGQVYGTYPNTSIWITEYALNDANLLESQSFFNTSAEYFDRLDYIKRYSYFGSFRSSVSNVGPNAAMLDQKGRLTDIGSWYLGGVATNNIPGTSGAVTIGVNSLWAAAVLVVAAFRMF